MNKNRFRARGAAAGTWVVCAGLLVAGGPAAVAAEGDVLVTNTETVQAYLSATGDLDVARVYEQVAMDGEGTVELRNPVSTEGLRNLDGFGGFEVKDGQMVGTYTVEGEKRLRAVSDYTKKLPLEVEVSYTFDGKKVDPADVVGKSGTLGVDYVVRNVTGTPQTVEYGDGTGRTQSSTEDVVIPMVGSLSTVLPSNFTDVRSEEANIAGDGRGGTRMSFTMTLFGPIGSPEASFGYEATVTDAFVPKASISALPVSPLESPSFRGGAESYKGGADTGAALTAGATEIDANLLKLRDGAGQLLAGLIKLRDGAQELNDGLAGRAAPGAEELADGAGQLKDGTDQLSDGATRAKDGSGKVADGASRLSDGASQIEDGAGQLADGLATAGDRAPQLLDGLAQVADGLDQLDAGLVTLYGGIGQLPAKAKPLSDGIAQLRGGIGAVGTNGTLLDGVDQIRAGFSGAVAPRGSLDQLKGGVDQSKGGVDQSKGGVDQVRQGLAAALAPGGGLDQLNGGVNLAKSSDCGPVCQNVLDQVLAGLGTLRTDTANAKGGLDQVSTGLGQVSGGLTQVSGGLTTLKTSISNAVTGLIQIECGLSSSSLSVCDSTKPGLLQGLVALDAGILELVNGVVAQVQGGIGDDDDTKVDKTLRGGVHSLQDGVDQIAVGGIALIDGLYQLGDGAVRLEDGTGQLSGGAADLADGAGQLDDGLGDLADGANRLDEGAGRLSDGASELSAGLGDAADGSGRLADGLEQAADGAPALEDGAQRLSDEGTKKLIEAGRSTATDYGLKYALIEAGAERASSEAMAYGAPEGAEGLTAYSYELAAVDGEGGRNLTRGLAALAIFGTAAGLLLLRRGIV